MRVSVLSVAAIGPGFDDYASLCQLIDGTMVPDQPLPATTVPKAMSLPSTERRRVGIPVRIALAVAEQVFAQCPVTPPETQSVFASSSGDGTNCHQLCEALADTNPVVSPTKFTNSVHNAAAGYWGIATGSMKASASLCSFDESLVAGLLEAAAIATFEQEPVVLVSFDAPYPTPLKEKRPIHDAMGIAMVFAPAEHEQAIAHLELNAPRAQQTETPVSVPALETLRLGIPAARGLPLLAALTQDQPSNVTLNSTSKRSMTVRVEPCN